MIQTIRNGLVKGLHEFVNCPVVPTDNNNPKPPYPFVSYKITTLNQYTGDDGVIIDGFAESLSQGFRYDYIQKVEIQPYMIISFSIYSDDLLESQNLGLRCWEWFKLHGKGTLSAINVVGVDIGNLQDRTTHLVDFYEYKQGFDVTIRWLHQFENRSETIESYKIEGGIE